MVQFVAIVGSEPPKNRLPDDVFLDREPRFYLVSLLCLGILHASSVPEAIIVIIVGFWTFKRALSDSTSTVLANPRLLLFFINTWLLL